jgi:hypothetical protein
MDTRVAIVRRRLPLDVKSEVLQSDIQPAILRRLQQAMSVRWEVSATQTTYAATIEPTKTSTTDLQRQPPVTGLRQAALSPGSVSPVNCAECITLASPVLRHHRAQAAWAALVSSAARHNLPRMACPSLAPRRYRARTRPRTRSRNPEPARRIHRYPHLAAGRLVNSCR